jgi:hypothetical protein
MGIYSLRWLPVCIAVMVACLISTVHGATPPPAPTTQSAVAPVRFTSSKRIHEMSERELGDYAARLRQEKPTPAERVAHTALLTIGQPYVESAPIFAQTQSDCVTFVEHCLATAMADSWESYCRLTARLRYQGGLLPLPANAMAVSQGKLTVANPDAQVLLLRNRNHFMLGEWDRNNAWCLTDVTKDLGAGPIKPWIPLHHIARRKDYLAKQGLQADLPDLKVVDAFVPRESIAEVLPQLQSGDVLYIIVGTWDNRYCDHVGILVKETPWDSSDPDGPPSIVHSVPPKVRRESLVRFLRRFPFVQGLKVMRLKPDAQETAAREDAQMATRLTVPAPPGP